MKFYLFLAIVICKASSYFSYAEHDLTDTRINPSLAAIGLHPLPDDDYPGQRRTAELVKRAVPRTPAVASSIQARRRSALDKNFMRFGRTDKTMGLVGAPRYGRANLMRFGRADRAFLRFGRTAGPAVVLDDLSKEYIGGASSEEDAGVAKRTPAGNLEEYEVVADGTSSTEDGLKPKQIIYYRRDVPKNLMRFGKRRTGGTTAYLRFGRGGSGSSLMRFGRGDDGRAGGGSNLMRFGRAGSLMRFGRSGLGGANATDDGTKAPETLPPNLLGLFASIAVDDPLVPVNDVATDTAVPDEDYEEVHSPFYIVDN